MDRKTFFVIVVGFLALAFLGGMVALQTTALLWVFSEEDDSSGLDELLEEYIDGQVDAGFVDGAFDVDDPLLGQRKILLAHTVNARTAKHVTTRLIYLDGLDGTRPIDLLISTQGGYVDSAFTIIDAMRLIDAPVNTWAIGGCYSAGAMVLASGTGVRRASDNAIIMVHTNDNGSEEPYSYDRLGRERYERLWRETASLPDDWFPMTTEVLYYVSPQEALDFDLVDEISPSGGPGAGSDLVD